MLGTSDADAEENPIATFEQVKRLPYLEVVINETLRIHSTAGLGLPRLVPEGGLTVCGRFFQEGTVLSVPTYTIHRDREVWGEDPDAFRPERWFERDKTLVQKTFNPFSFGPRLVCVFVLVAEVADQRIRCDVQELRGEKPGELGAARRRRVHLPSVRVRVGGPERQGRCRDGVPHE